MRAEDAALWSFLGKLSDKIDALENKVEELEERVELGEKEWKSRQEVVAGTMRTEQNAGPEERHYDNGDPWFTTGSPMKYKDPYWAEKGE